MILQNNKQKAFTIVELLIVIVVIGILAAISIVSYNGIQNRARDTSVKNSASQVRTKIEAWNSIIGSYPAVGDVTGGLNNTGAPEARIDTEVVNMITSGTPPIATSHGTGRPIQVTPCGSSPITGYIIAYYQSGDNGRTVIGTGCPSE